MLNLNALGFFMNYCNNHFDAPGINELFKVGSKEILNSHEGRFSNCHTVQDVMEELSNTLDFQYDQY